MWIADILEAEATGASSKGNVFHLCKDINSITFSVRLSLSTVLKTAIPPSTFTVPLTCFISVVSIYHHPTQYTSHSLVGGFVSLSPAPCKRGTAHAHPCNTKMETPQGFLLVYPVCRTWPVSLYVLQKRVLNEWMNNNAKKWDLTCRWEGRKRWWSV